MIKQNGVAIPVYLNGQQIDALKWLVKNEYLARKRADNPKHFDMVTTCHGLLEDAAHQVRCKQEEYERRAREIAQHYRASASEHAQAYKVS